MNKPSMNGPSMQGGADARFDAAVRARHATALAHLSPPPGRTSPSVAAVFSFMLILCGIWLSKDAFGGRRGLSSSGSNQANRAISTGQLKTELFDDFFA